MWTTSSVTTAHRVGVPLLVLLAVSEVAMAVGLIPMTLFWGPDALAGSAGKIASALFLVFMAHIIDKRATEVPDKWMETGAWLVTVVVIVMAVTNLLSHNVLERLILGIVDIVTAICCAIVSSSSPNIVVEPIYEPV